MLISIDRSIDRSTCARPSLAQNQRSLALRASCFVLRALLTRSLIASSSDVHTLLDLMSLGATAAVVYAMRGPLKATYQKEFDSMHNLMVIAPCLLLAVFIHPSTRHNFLLRIMWAFCVYLEAVSVLPQLRMMQKSGHVEKFTAHYVFALGLSRFVAASHWILQLLEGNSMLYRSLTSLWPLMVLVSEIVQTGILADFCWIYVKSYRSGSGTSRSLATRCGRCVCVVVCSFVLTRSRSFSLVLARSGNIVLPSVGIV